MPNRRSASTDPVNGPFELIVGSRVRTPEGFCGTVVTAEFDFDPGDDYTYIYWDGATYSVPYPHHELLGFKRLCRNCDLSLEEHANEGKCLYGPTSWTP